MSAPPTDSPAKPPPGNQLLRVLDVTFGVAVILGSTIGVGILRLPGMVAGELRNFWLILLVWVLGGSYALLGSFSVTELGAMLPQAGGFYVYARRAFGAFAGFAAGQLVMFQQMGFGVGVALLVDATLIRMVAVPAAMTLLGRWNWYLPSWLNWMPELHLEGDPETKAVPAEVPASVPMPV